MGFRQTFLLYKKYVDVNYFLIDFKITHLEFFKVVFSYATLVEYIFDFL